MQYNLLPRQTPHYMYQPSLPFLVRDVALISGLLLPNFLHGCKIKSGSGLGSYVRVIEWPLRVVRRSLGRLRGLLRTFSSLQASSSLQVVMRELRLFNFLWQYLRKINYYKNIHAVEPLLGPKIIVLISEVSLFQGENNYVFI